MACPGDGILTDLARILVTKTREEVNYFLHFETHDNGFTQELRSLIGNLDEVQKDIEDAKTNNQNQILVNVQDWIDEARNLIQNKTEIKQSRFDSWCPLIRQYRQGKRLAQRTQTIQDHNKKCNFEIVARPAELLDMKYNASRDFIDFESRKTKFKQLVEALEDGNHYMIGLQGMGGTGKTTLATQVGKQVEESKVFEKVIFVVVSNPPDVNKIQGDIARQLGLRLEESDEADHSKSLWSSIYKNGKKLLIILDDVWEELNLTEIGIPSGLDHKNCYVLITTRHSNVCQAMKCQQIVRLDTLDDEDALRLFRFHATSDDDNSSRNELGGLARYFLKECGGLPVAIVALARTLTNLHVGELNMALRALQNSKSLVGVHDDLVKVYSCLRLSYDYLHNEKAQKLFLLCSIFPEDYEFPVNLVIRLGIGAGIFEEADDYCAARIQALAVRKKLIDSSLLQKVGEKECVKMHDLVREVAQWIAKEYIQVIKDSRTILRTNKRFVFWSTEDFPDQFDDTNLEILLLRISGNVQVKDPNSFFAGMSRLKILFLLGECDGRVPSPLLSKSLLSLKDIHTLILEGWELGDISILKNIQSLATLEFKNCVIMELPRNIMELKKLRWLGLRKCEIQRKNPFEVIKRCSQLEELYFVENYSVKDWTTEDEKEIEDEIAHDISLAELQLFSIASGFERFNDDDNGLLRCFNPEHIRHLIPDAMFKYLVRSVEVLELGKIGQTSWKNLAPDIIPLENGGMDNLIKLYLYEWDDIECLIDNSKYHYSNTTFFSKLVELHLYHVDVKKLYRGAMPSRFLGQLQILKLKKCMKLQNIFFDENIKLPHLKVLRLIGCPMFQPSIFQPSVAQSLERLEELVVKGCEELKSLIAYENLKEEMIVVGGQKIYGLLFPALKSLRIEGCGKLEMVFSLLLLGDLPKLKDLYINKCKELKYIVGEYRVVGQVLQQEIILPLLTEVTLYDVPSFISIFQDCKKCVLSPPQVFKEDSKEKHENSKANAFSWAYGCCFLAPTKDSNIGVPNATMEHHTLSQGSSGSIKRMETSHTTECLMMETSHTTECLMRHPLSLQNIRQMRLWECSKLKSLFNASIAKTMIMLEKLDIWECEELKHIITNEAKDDDHLNCTSIFPKLHSLQIRTCNKLEFIFPSTLSAGLQKLKSIDISKAHELKYVFGKYNEEECVSNENENNELHIHLPTLETIFLCDVPNMISIGVKKYQQKCTSLQIVESTKEIKKHMQDVTSERAKESELQEIVNFETPLTPTVGFQYCLNFDNLKEIKIERNKKLNTLFSVSACRNLPQLSKLTIEECEELVNVVEDDSHDHHHMNYSSIFPKLEDLTILNCNKLEFIISSTFSGGLQKLKSILISGADELKFVFGKYNEENRVSNENENNKPHIHLPVLESLYLWDVPNMISIGVKKYPQKCPSLQIVEAPEEIKKHEQYVTSETTKESELQEIVNFETPLTPSVGFQYFLNFHNLKKIEIWGSKKFTTLFSISTCTNLQQLSKLTIEECEELINVVEDDSNDHHHMNYSSIFPKLEDLFIKDCNKLEFIFPLSLFGSLQKLKSLIIKKAAELNCIFGNESAELHIHLPTTLETLSFVGIPKIMNKILAKKYHVSFLCLQSIELGDLQEFNVRSFLDLMAYLQEIQLNVKVPKDLTKIIKDVKKLTKLGIRDSKIEEVLNLEGVEIEGTILTLSLEEMWLKDLSELNHICKGPKYIFSLPNLRQLDIIACKKLRVIFSVSIVKSLPQLNDLTIEDCNELVDIIEESVEGHLPQICFPVLKTISIKRCNSLKCMFSISTCGKFPKLWLLEIEEASELEQVFIHKQDDMQKMTMMDEVFPELSYVILRKLPMLITICEGIDFQNVRCSMNDCPKYQGINHIQEGPEDEDSENQTATNDSPDFAESSKEAMTTSVEEVASSFSKKETVKEIEAKDPTPALLEKQALEGSTTKPQLRRTSLHNYKETEKEGGIVVLDPASKLLAPTSSSFQIMEETLIEIQAKDSNRASGKEASEISTAKSHLRGASLPELEDEHKTSESIMQLQQEGLVETKTTKASHKTNIPFHDNSIDAILKERAEEGSTSEDVVAATMVADLAPRNSWDLMPSKSRSEMSMAHSLELATNSVTSSVVSQVEGSKFGPSTLSSEKTEKEAVRIQTSQLSIDPTWTNSETTQSIKDTKEQGHEENYAEEYSYSRKQSIGPIDNLPRKDSAPSAKDTTKGIDGNATATYKSPMTILEIGDHSSIQEEAESEKPIKATLPQVIPSLHYLSHIADSSTSFSKLGICEIFKLVEQKHGETALLAQALEQYPQLLLPREHRTHRIIAWSYRVLVDILVMLATKTPNTITPFEKSTLEANLSEAIVLGFDKDWVESVRVKVFGVDMSDVSKAIEEIQVMEVKLREIDSQLLGLSEDRKKLIVNMNMLRDIVSVKDKPFGI